MLIFLKRGGLLLTLALLGLPFVGVIGCGPNLASATFAQPVNAHNPYGIFSVPNDPRTGPALSDLGVSWVRLQSQIGQEQPKDDPRIQHVLDAGYGLWLTLHYRDRSNVKDVARFDATTRGGFPPADPARFQSQVQEALEPLVEQLQEQGKNPGAWLIVQFSNEVAPEDILPPSPIRFWHGSSDAYLQTLGWVYDAVKALDPEIPVAAGGISSGTLELILDHAADPAAVDPRAGQIVDWNERLLREGRFDWADVHLYHTVGRIPEKVAWVKARWRGPLAATEMGGPDEQTGAIYTEAAQAADLPTRLQTALDAGVDRVFWSFLQDRDIPGDRLAQTLGLIDRNWQRKPAFFAYRDLIAVKASKPQTNLPITHQTFTKPSHAHITLQSQGVLRWQ